MIIIIEGDIFSNTCEAVVNPVNCQGVMGKGLALKFKERYYDNYKAYYNYCKKHKLMPGGLFLYKESANKYIINLATKGRWVHKSKIEYIKNGLVAIASTIKDLELSSIAIPKIGCGLGGLDWAEVLVEIEDILGDIPNTSIYIYE